MNNRPRADKMESWQRIAIIAWTLVGVLLLLSFGLWLLSFVSSVLTPLLLALVVVFLLRRPVAALNGRGMPRGIAVMACYLLFFVVLTAAGLFVVPPITREVREFVEVFPSLYDDAYELWLQLEQTVVLVELPEWIRTAAETSRESVVEWTSEVTRNVARSVVSVGGRIVSFFVNVFLALALAFFVLRDLPTLKSEVLSLPGPTRQQESLKLAADVTVVLEGFLRGQLMIATIVGVATGVGLAVLGVPYALVIGLIAGITNLVPYLGPIVGGVIAAISASFLGWDTVLLTLVWIVVLQQVESMFLQPKIMSDQVHLHPVLVIVSLLVGATLFGLIGMLVAVPLAAVIKVLFIHYYEKWTESRISDENGALFRSPRPRGARAKRYSRTGAATVSAGNAGTAVTEDPTETVSDGRCDCATDETHEGDPGEGR